MMLAYAIAGIVGSGWLLGPMACAKIAGPASIISWIIGGIMMMVVAACFVMIARAIPMTGGTVRFFKLTYGEFASFSFSWIAWIAWIAVSPIEVMALLQYSASYIPGIMTTGANPVLTHGGMLAAMACIVVFSVINSYGSKSYGRINYVILAFKIFIPVTTVALIAHHHIQIHHLAAAGGFAPYGIKSIFAALPMAGVIYSFIGFNPAIQMAAETKNPKRAIPIAIFGSLIVCMVLYTCIQFVFVTGIPSSSIAHGWASLHFSGDHSPFVGLLTGLGFIAFVKVLYVDAMISPFGTAMVQSTATARMTYAMSENGYLPKFLQRINRYRAPQYAIIFNMIIGFAFLMPFPSWQRMVGFLQSCLVLGYIVGPMSLMVFIHKQPNFFSKHSKGIAQVISIAAFYICNLMIFWSGWGTIEKMMCLFAAGYVVFAIYYYRQMRAGTAPHMHFIRGSWVIAYAIGMGIISKCSSFGGNHMISFGIDFAVMGVFSAAIFYMAHSLASKTCAPSDAVSRCSWPQQLTADAT